MAEKKTDINLFVTFMESIIQCIFVFCNLNLKIYKYMQNHDYPRLSYMISDYYKNTKSLIKSLKSWDLTYVQKTHIIDLLKSLRYDYGIILDFLDKEKLWTMYNTLYFCKLNLESI